MSSESVPTHHGLRTDQDQHSVPIAPTPPENDPEKAIAIGQYWFSDAALEDKELSAQGQVFEQEPATTSKQVQNGLEAYQGNNKHARRRMVDGALKSIT